MTGLVWLFIGAVFCPLVLAIPVENDQDNSDLALTWLKDYGYLRPTGDLTVESVGAAVLRMQNFLNLPETGKVDEETLRVMRMPRCGVPDFEPDEDYTKSERYVTRSAWPASQRQLTYRIETYTSDMNNADIERDFATAFQQWQNKCGLTFTKKTSGSANILMKFTPDKYHGDAAFSATTLAHAYYPLTSRDGDVHYNDAFTFRKAGSASSGNYDLQYITLHELGHSIGLKHSGVSGAIMEPYYRDAYANNAVLQADDIAGARKLYGA